jgi:fluoride exporter
VDALRIVIGIMAAGAVGALLRYTVDGLVSPRVSGLFPWGTFVINISGSLVLGFLFTIFTERAMVAPWVRSSITIGLLGAYTTFSTLSLESVQLIEERVYGLAFLNAAGSLAAGMLAVTAGIILGRAV